MTSYTSAWRKANDRILWLCIIHHHHHNCFTALFPGPPRWVGARTELLDFTVQGKINRGRHTHHPDGRHSIWTKQCPSPPWLCIIDTAKLHYGHASEEEDIGGNLWAAMIGCRTAHTCCSVAPQYSIHFVKKSQQAVGEEYIRWVIHVLWWKRLMKWSKERLNSTAATIHVNYL